MERLKPILGRFQMEQDTGSALMVLEKAILDATYMLQKFGVLGEP
jgi:hypothetical protein